MAELSTARLRGQEAKFRAQLLHLLNNVESLEKPDIYDALATQNGLTSNERTSTDFTNTVDWAHAKLTENRMTENTTTGLRLTPEGRALAQKNYAEVGRDMEGSGKLETPSKLNPGPRTYLLLRSNDVTDWNDEEGRIYHYGRTVPNYKTIGPNASVILDRRFADGAKLIGKATVKSVDVDPRNEDQFIATYSEYTPIEPPIPMDPDRQALLAALPNYNRQHSVRVLDKKTFDSLLDVAPAASESQRLNALMELSNLEMVQLQEIESLLKDKRQLIFEGPPGAGKTFIADLFGRYLTDNALTGSTDSKYVLVQFHQSYSYEDFMLGIRPFTNADGRLSYRVEDGIFKRLCQLAQLNPNDKFVILIDEINRGNVSRIFGELLLLLEYRDKQILLPYATAGDNSPELFSIPPKIFVIGTMNTADRSLAQVDYALRRRFYFYRLQPVVNGDAPTLRRWLRKQGAADGDIDRVVRVFVNLNNRVQEFLGGDFQIGHSYLMVPRVYEPPQLERIWKHAITPLLNEYFYGRRDRDAILQSLSLENLMKTQ